MKRKEWSVTDQELIQASIAGNHDAFRELVRRYERQVAATVYGMLGSCPEADDVGQETFIRFFRNLKKFRGEAAVSTYLTRIAINLSLNELKRRKRRALFSLNRNSGENGELESTLEAPDESKQYDGEKDLIQAALQKLEPKFRSVVVLRLLEGYSTEETAKILDVPKGTVLSRLSRAQKKLKELLLPYMEEIS